MNKKNQMIQLFYIRRRRMSAPLGKADLVLLSCNQ